ncbi:MAG: glycosyltransferase family 2 protein [Desulfobulbus sp.]
MTTKLANGPFCKTLDATVYYQANMNHKLDFTIIIPAKNEERNIGNCLASIFSIDYDKHRYEVVVVDNGSEDRTNEIAKNMGATVYEKPGLTISGLRNFGASQAQGNILVFLDADCTVKKNWLEAATPYLEMQDVAAFGSAPILPKDSTWVQRTWFHIREKKQTIEDVEWLESMNMFIPRHVFFSVGGFDESLITCEDYDLSKRLGRHGRIVSDKRIRAVHHGEAKTLTHFFLKERWRATSNYRNISTRIKNFSEWPSIVVPLVHLLLVVALCTVLVYSLTGYSISMYFTVLFYLWQGALLLLAAWRTRPVRSLLSVAQLFVLLNVYFTARGCAVLGSGRR